MRAPARRPGLFFRREPGPTRQHPGSLGKEILPGCQVLEAPEGRAKESPSSSPPSPSEWIRDYTDSVSDPEALRVEVDAFMETYDRKIAEVGLPHGRWLAGPPSW